MLAKVTEYQQEWDLYLPKVLFACRSSLHETTGFTPYHLKFGCSPQLPIDLMLGCVNKPKLQSYSKLVTQTHQYLTQANSLARKCLTQHHVHQKQVHDSKGTAAELQVGNVVWLYTPVVCKGNTNKFSFWKGPYTIVDKVGPVNYKLQLVGGTRSLVVVHQNRIKLCYNVEQYSPQSNLACN